MSPPARQGASIDDVQAILRAGHALGASTPLTTGPAGLQLDGPKREGRDGARAFLMDLFTYAGFIGFDLEEVVREAAVEFRAKKGDTPS